MPAGSSFKCCASTLQTISGPIYHVFLGPKSVFQFLSARNVPVINNITWLPAVLVKCSNVVSVACRIQFVTYSIRNVGNGIFRQKFLDPDRELDQHQNRMFFLPRDDMRKRVFAVARCPSVRPSVCHVRAFYPYGWRCRQTSLSAR